MKPESASTSPEDDDQDRSPSNDFHETTPDRRAGAVTDNEQPYSTSITSLPLQPFESDNAEPASDELDFDQIIDAKLFPTLAEVWGVKDAYEDNYVPQDGECVFLLSQARLYTLINVLECAVPMINGQHGTIKLKVEDEELSGRSSFNDAFCDAHIDLLRPVHFSKDLSKLAFVVAFDDLRATQRGLIGPARLTYSSQERRLTVSSERFERPLHIEPERLFIDHSNVKNSITDDTPPVRLSSNLLRICLSYVFSQTPANKFDASINVTQVRDGLAVSGTPYATAFAQHKELGNTRFSIHNKNLDQFIHYLSKVPNEEIRLKAVENYYLVDAHYSTFGFARTWKMPSAAEVTENTVLVPVEQQFPPVDSILKLDDYEHQILLPTKVLLSALRAFLIADDEKRSLRFRVRNDRLDPKCAFSVKFADHKEAQICLDSQSLKRQLDDPLVDFQIPLRAMFLAISALPGKKTEISICKKKKYLKICDSSDFDFQSFLGWENEDGCNGKSVKSNLGNPKLKVES